MSFSLMLGKGTESELEEQLKTEVNTQALKGKRILLVEDNATNRILANNILAQYGAEVVEAEDGSVAIEKMKGSKFDLVLMDMQMPVMNGLDATRYIRTHLDKSIPIVALSASAYKQEQDKCLNAGMNDFISKPLDEDKMIRQIAEWLGKERIGEEKQLNGKSNVQENFETEFDLSTIFAFANGNNDFLYELTKVFVKELFDNIARIELAFGKKEWTDIAAIAHKIRPSVSSFKQEPMAVVLSELENMNTDVADAKMVEKHILFLKKAAKEFSIKVNEFLAGGISG